MPNDEHNWSSGVPQNACWVGTSPNAMLSRALTIANT